MPLKGVRLSPGGGGRTQCGGPLTEPRANGALGLVEVRVETTQPLERMVELLSMVGKAL